MITVAVRIDGKNHNRPLPVQFWTSPIRFEADKIIRETLSGVGVSGSDVTQFKSITRVVRRMAQDAERVLVTEKYVEERFCLMKETNP